LIFNPTEYDPKEWVRIAKETGFDYITFTTKHHDGFCMWDTKYSDYKITNTPYGKDVLKMLSDECEKQGMGLSLYYSCPDWHHPNYLNTIGHHEIDTVKDGDEPNEALYIEYVKNQLRELLTGYGKIQSFFWDIPPKTRDKSLNELIRSLQPGIYINNRGYDEGDFSTPERMSADGASFDGLCEACDSIGKESWGYRRHEDYHSKYYITSSIDRYMAMGANFVLNVGPDEKGNLPEKAKAILSSVSSWYNNVKEALFAEPVKYEWASKYGFITTKKDNRLYLHFTKIPEADGFFIKEIKAMPKSASVLNDGTKLSILFEQIPSLFNGHSESMIDVCHISGIDVDALSSEAVIIKLEFENLDNAFGDTSEDSKRIL
jgi:alpha-L-fucosidase